ncbi:MAG: hypothetical protein AAGH38_02660, partial [Pseudomonadota bacterium]
GCAIIAMIVTATRSTFRITKNSYTGDISIAELTPRATKVGLIGGCSARRRPEIVQEFQLISGSGENCWTAVSAGS